MYYDIFPLTALRGFYVNENDVHVRQLLGSCVLVMSKVIHDGMLEYRKGRDRENRYSSTSGNNVISTLCLLPTLTSVKGTSSLLGFLEGEGSIKMLPPSLNEYFHYVLLDFIPNRLSHLPNIRAFAIFPILALQSSLLLIPQDGKTRLARKSIIPLGLYYAFTVLEYDFTPRNKWIA